SPAPPLPAPNHARSLGQAERTWAYSSIRGGVAVAENKSRVTLQESRPRRLLRRLVSRFRSSYHCADPEVRIIVPQPRLRTSESTRHTSVRSSPACPLPPPARWESENSRSRRWRCA